MESLVSSMTLMIDEVATPACYVLVAEYARVAVITDTSFTSTS